MENENNVSFKVDIKKHEIELYKKINENIDYVKDVDKAILVLLKHLKKRNIFHKDVNKLIKELFNISIEIYDVLGKKYLQEKKLRNNIDEFNNKEKEIINYLRYESKILIKLSKKTDILEKENNLLDRLIKILENEARKKGKIINKERIKNKVLELATNIHGAINELRLIEQLKEIARYYDSFIKELENSLEKVGTITYDRIKIEGYITIKTRIGMILNNRMNFEKRIKELINSINLTKRSIKTNKQKAELYSKLLIKGISILESEIKQN